MHLYEMINGLLVTSTRRGGVRVERGVVVMHLYEMINGLLVTSTRRRGIAGVEYVWSVAL